MTKNRSLHRPGLPPRSSAVSYLIGQSQVATDALRHDNEARRTLRELLTSADGDPGWLPERLRSPQTDSTPMVWTSLTGTADHSAVALSLTPARHSKRSPSPAIHQPCLKPKQSLTPQPGFRPCTCTCHITSHHMSHNITVVSEGRVKPSTHASGGAAGWWCHWQPDPIESMHQAPFIRRATHPDKMVGPALLLCSDAGSFITGQVIVATLRTSSKVKRLIFGAGRPIMKVSSGTAPEGRREFRSARPRTRREVGRLGREPGLSHFWSSVGHLDHASSSTSKSPAARSTPHASNTLYATPDSHRTTNTCGDGRPRAPIQEPSSSSNSLPTSPINLPTQ